MMDIWTQYEVEWRFLTKLVSSVPADGELIKRWLESRKPATRPPDSKSIDEVAAEVMESLPEQESEEVGMHVFQRTEGGLAVRMATIRAHLKECARTLSRLYVGKVEGEKSFSVKVVQGLYYPPEVYWLPVLSQWNGHQCTEPSGTYEKPVHAMTPRGAISALKQFEYVENALLRFSLLVLTPKSGKSVVSREDLETLMQYGGVHGYAGERSDGEGRYVATITEKSRNGMD
jgi:hypothetical protein